MSDRIVAQQWLERPEDIIEIIPYSNLIVIHLEGQRRVEIESAGDKLSYYIRDKEDK
jgi:hypothetical protein